MIYECGHESGLIVTSGTSTELSRVLRWDASGRKICYDCFCKNEKQKIMNKLNKGEKING